MQLNGWCTLLALLPAESQPAAATHGQALDFMSMLFVFMLATFIGIGVIRRVSRLLHTPLMSLTNAISAIAVVGSIIVTGSEYPPHIRVLGAIALNPSAPSGLALRLLPGLFWRDLAQVADDPFLAPPLRRLVAPIHPSLYMLFNLTPLLRTHVLCWAAKTS